MEPLVSVIIPVYNADYSLLVSCIQSVINQTYKNIEILIIDDGSTKGNAKKYEEIKTLDVRIKVIHQENQGVSRARNNGTRLAEGDYVFYVDGDDVVAPIAIEEGVKRITQDDVDLVIGAVEKITKHSQFSNTQRFTERYDILKEDQFDKLRKQYTSSGNSEFKNISGNGYIIRGPVCRIIRKNTAILNEFPGGLPIGEDIIWNMNLLDRCQKVCIVHNIWYGYLKQDNSAVRKYHGDRIEKVEAYLNTLYKNHTDFCESNIEIFGKNIAVEFYCILRYELLSKECHMSMKEKNKTVQELLHKRPWIVMNEKIVKNSLPIKNRMLLMLCRLNLWQPAMSFLYRKD